jgi:hypothetical protein
VFDEIPAGVLLPVDDGEAMSDRRERTVRALSGTSVANRSG